MLFNYGKQCLYILILCVICILIMTIMRSNDKYEIIPNNDYTQLPQDHSFLVKLIKQEFISSPPSKQTRDPFTEVMSKESNSQYGQDTAILKLLNALKGGFFIECGGNDGVSWSNTLMLEIKHDWTGLLVEANPKQYKKLKSLNRHVNSINSCLSTSPYPEKMQFRSYTNHTGLSGLMSGAKGPHDIWQGKKLKVEDTVSVQCFPLYSILLALGNPTVHYFSLDVEGVELQVLKTVPWEKVDIKVLTVEASHSDAQSIKKFMEANNYILHTKLTEDFVFVKKGFKITE